MSDRAHAAAAVVVVLMIAAGCDSQPPPPAAAPSHPGVWDAETVLSKVKSSMRLEAIELEPTDGGYEGTGTMPSGEVMTITVRQFDKELNFEAVGDKGSKHSGRYAFN